MGRMVRRLVQLYRGLAFYGLGISLQVSSGLGNGPWDVFHQGLSRHTPGPASPRAGTGPGEARMTRG